MNLRNLFNGKLYYYLKPKINIDNEKNHINPNLENLFKQYGTDKANFIDKKIGHGYTKFYLKHLNKFKKKEINILEIGSYSGASAAAFSKFFRKAKIFCLDINISNFKYQSKKIKVFALDACNKQEVDFFLKNNNINVNKNFFDIIIDDGSHKLIDILKGIKLFFSLLRPDGFYIIEDYKFDNANNKNVISIDKLKKKIFHKKKFKSEILDCRIQLKLFNDIKKIYTYKGNLEGSRIIFFNKKIK